MRRSIAGLLLVACALVFVGLTQLRPEADPVRTELYFDYDAPDEEMAKTIRFDPDTLGSAAGKSLEEQIAEVKSLLKDEDDYEKRIDTQAKKAQPIEVVMKLGRRGPQGPPGLKGYRGPRGFPGYMGSPGPAGARGPIGPPGEKGIRGKRGPIGARGEQGLPGPRGKAGIRGRTGAMGEDGPQGPEGPRGYPGPDGVPGRPGAPGPPGLAAGPGPRGPPGPEGIPGPSGIRGPQGEVGGQGRQGGTGAQGEAGVPGVQGPRGPVGLPGRPQWRLAMRSRVDNSDWAYNSDWWTDERAYNAENTADGLNVKTNAFFTVRVNAVKVSMNKRTYILALPISLAGQFTLKDLVSRPAGLEMTSPFWRGSALDVFGIASSRIRNTKNRWYCSNFVFHYTPFFQPSIDSTTHCGAVARLGALMSEDRNCMSQNAAKPVAAEGLGLWNSCSNTLLGSGRVEGDQKYFFPATVWVS